MRRWMLALVIAGAGCSEQEQPRNAELLEPVDSKPLERIEVPEEVVPPSETRMPQVRPPAAPTGTAVDVKIGMERDALMAVMGNCAVRVYYVPPAEHRKMVEVIQPREGACVERFEERRFTLINNRLAKIQGGLERAILEERSAPPNEG